MSMAEALRRREHDGEILIIGEEADTPYDRPPLSKQVLSGDWDRERIRLLSTERMARIDATILSGVRAERLDVASHVITTSEGEIEEYDQLVIATGVRPRRLPGWDYRNVLTLRTFSDSQELRRRILTVGRLVIVGAGLIGLEVAATARKLGVEVTVLDLTRQPMADKLGAPAASRLLARHASEGVNLKLGHGPIRVHPSDGEAKGAAVAELELNDGSILEAPAVLIAIGAKPNVEWLSSSGLTLADGVMCDRYCQAAPDVWAIGDVANWYHAGMRRTMRIEHRTNASEQAACVATTMMGSPRPYLPTPFFWTDHFDIKIQVAGTFDVDSLPAFEVGSEKDGSFVMTFRNQGRMTAALGWNAVRELIQYRHLLASAARNLES
jgi:3-phenylpropionate/trans-cinnamate dioxygenase ferredoxin reductase subunit